MPPLLHQQESHLHSTMLLLYPRWPEIMRRLRHNLHSTMLLLYRNNLIFFRVIIPKFTFHYASTLSHWLFQCRFYCSNHLHSTMLLLYPLPLQQNNFLHQNLHSTMLLLYLTYTRRIKHIPTTFTFHYASTLSYARVTCLVLGKTFTFHYASTLSTRSGCSVLRFDVIYIPLCFYFIILDYVEWDSPVDLHSTMLLLYLNIPQKTYSNKENLHSTMLLLYPG